MARRDLPSGPVMAALRRPRPAQWRASHEPESRPRHWMQEEGGHAEEEFSSLFSGERDA